MSAQEILHRTLSLCGYFYDLMRFHIGRQSKIKIEVGSAARPLFENSTVKQFPGLSLSSEQFDFYRTLWIENKVLLFDKNIEYDLGETVQWLIDPKTKTPTPKKFGRSIDYRDDKSVGEIKYLWEIGRHQFLTSMAIHASFSSDHEIKEKLESHFRSWLDQNPVGMGIHWCNSLEIALRLISWSLIHSILKCGGMKDGIFTLNCNSELLKTHIYHQVKFVVNNYSRFSSANNHLVGELTGVWVTCNVFNLGSKGVKWRDAALADLEREAHLQTHEDGVNKEQAIYYHLWSTEYFWLTWLIAKRYEHSISEQFEERIIAMYNYLDAMCSFTLYPAQIGDSDDGVVSRFSLGIDENNFQSLLEPLSNILSCEKDFLNSSPNDIYSKNFWYQLILEGSDISSLLNCYNKSIQLKTNNDAYQNGGYYIFAGRDSRLMYKAGPFGYLSTAAHGHADALSVVLAIDGLWWLVDPGTYTYHSDGMWRNYFRGTAAHNTLCVNQKNQSRIAGDFLWDKKAVVDVNRVKYCSQGSKKYICQVTGSHNGYADRGVVHKRVVKYDGGHTFELLDLVTLSDYDDEYNLQLNFHFHPQIQLHEADKNIWIANHSNSVFTMTIELPDLFDWELKNGQENPIAGWYSPSYGVKDPSNSLVGSGLFLHSKNPDENAFRTLLRVHRSNVETCSNG